MTYNSEHRRQDEQGVGFQHLSKEHLEYIIVNYHILKRLKPGQLFEHLTDPEAYEKYGFVTVRKLSKHYFYKVLKSRIPETTVETVRLEYASGLLAVPIAHKRYRLERLNDALDEAWKTKDWKAVAQLTKRAQEEVGEEAWQEAIKESGKTTISLKELLQRKLTNEEDDD